MVAAGGEKYRVKSRLWVVLPQTVWSMCLSLAVGLYVTFYSCSVTGEQKYEEEEEKKLAPSRKISIKGGKYLIPLQSGTCGVG